MALRVAPEALYQAPEIESGEGRISNLVVVVGITAGALARQNTGSRK